MPGIEDVSFAWLTTAITAIGALGLAAVGLVDATKLFWGGISNVGFGHVERALAPFQPALTAAVGRQGDSLSLLKAHWLNGRPKDEQKAVAKSLIRLGLSPQNAAPLAAETGIAADRLVNAATLLANGDALSDAEINALGRFDAAVEARMDAAFEKADRQYRSAARNLAALFAVLLAVIAGATVYAPDPTTGYSGYLASKEFAVAILVGLIAVPLAPISKDLVSALSAAVRAVKAAKG